MSRREIQGLRAIVTGASSGIGLEIARELAKQGAQVLLTARRKNRLDDIAVDITAAGGTAFILAGDITAPGHRAELLSYAKQQMGGLDILVNNAGVGAVGPFLGGEPDTLRKVMEVNFFAPVELIREAGALLREGQRPVIVNIGSVLGHRAVPSKSEYCASKFALHGFSDSLRAELAKEKIDVVLVSPSTTSSEFFEQLIEDKGTAAKNPYGMAPNRVAKKVVRAIRSGRHEVILSLSGKLLVWLDRMFPSVADRIVERFG
ncbi:MAG: SDR family NAD(P)-dependent oxidoreductase [Planctomycetota bacterium]